MRAEGIGQPLLYSGRTRLYGTEILENNTRETVSALAKAFEGTPLEVHVDGGMRGQFVVRAVKPMDIYSTS